MRGGHETVLIICEGQKTEPYLFQSIIDKIGDSNIKYTIFPEAKLEEGEGIDEVVSHKRKRKKRITKAPSHNEVDIEVISAPLPLNWVKTGKKELQDNTYNEVWVVFDHDDFPARKEAFEEAELGVNGEYVKIVFSSRSFEYYLLSHFEQVYSQFEKTDCKFKEEGKKNKTFIRCGTNKYEELDCNGTKCINGYAQIKGYWQNSDDDNTKKSKTFYDRIKSKLEIGFENSSWIRFQSNIHENEKQIYDRNPYIHNTDKLIKKLLQSNLEHKWIRITEVNRFEEIELKVTNNSVEIQNKSQITIIIPQNSMELHSDSIINIFGDRYLIYPNDTISIELDKLENNNSFYKFKYKTFRIMFKNEA